MRSLRRILMLAACVSAWAQPALAGRIVVANDEWTLSQTGFANTPVGSAQFALNVGSFFTGGGPGSFLIVSDNFGLDVDDAVALGATMTLAGHAWVDSEDVPGFTLDLPTLQNYDGVFFALPPAVDQSVLTNYVNAGGNVFIEGGTGVGGSASEAANWNTFLNAFGLNFASSYNGIAGNIAIASSHAVMAGVPSLYQNNGNTISLFGANPNAQIIASFNGQGLYAVYDDVAAVPEPASLLLLTTGAAGLLAGRRRRRAR